MNFENEKPRKMVLEVSSSDEEVGYVRLPSHPGPGTPGVVQTTVALSDLLERNCGAERIGDEV